MKLMITTPATGFPAVQGRNDCNGTTTHAPESVHNVRPFF